MCVGHVRMCVGHVRMCVGHVISLLTPLRTRKYDNRKDKSLMCTNRCWPNPLLNFAGDHFVYDHSPSVSSALVRLRIKADIADRDLKKDLG